MAEDSQEKEGLSFKEQILRDLAKAKGTEQPKPVEESNNLQEKFLLHRKRRKQLLLKRIYQKFKKKKVANQS